MLVRLSAIRAVGCLLLFVLPVPAAAQNPDKHVDVALSLQGGVLSFDAKRFFCCAVVGLEGPISIKGRQLGFVVDVGFHYAGKSDTAGGVMTTYMGGVKKRLTASPNHNTFVQGLVGVQKYFGTNVAAQVGAGLDVRSKRHLFIRVEGDVLAVASLTGLRAGFRATIGVVVPFTGGGS